MSVYLFYYFVVYIGYTIDHYMTNNKQIKQTGRSRKVHTTQQRLSVSLYTSRPVHRNTNFFSGFAQIRCIIHVCADRRCRRGSLSSSIAYTCSVESVGTCDYTWFAAATTAAAAIVKILEKSILVVTRYSCCAVKNLSKKFLPSVVCVFTFLIHETNQYIFLLVYLFFTTTVLFMFTNFHD